MQQDGRSRAFPDYMVRAFYCLRQSSTIATPSADDASFREVSATRLIVMSGFLTSCATPAASARSIQVSLPRSNALRRKKFVIRFREAALRSAIGFKLRCTSEAPRGTARPHRTSAPHRASHKGSVHALSMAHRHFPASHRRLRPRYTIRAASRIHVQTPLREIEERHEKSRSPLEFGNQCDNHRSECSYGKSRGGWKRKWYRAEKVRIAVAFMRGISFDHLQADEPGTPLR